MRLTIDNLDGVGARDYTAAISADAPFAIERVLNAPSRCTGALLLAGSTLPAPARRGRVVVTSDTGLVLFTGYLATDPVAEYAGAGMAGAVYRVAIAAISDEWLLDKQTCTLTGAGFALANGTLLEQITQQTAAGVLSTAGVTATAPVGVFVPEAAKPWSTNAGAVASTTCAAYRAVEGGLTLQPVGSITHTLDFDTGGGLLQAASLQTAMAKELANDVTVSGEIEPTAYVTEMFSGDGTTAIFQLSQNPYRSSKPTLLSDSFDAGGLNPQIWNVTDPGAHLALGAGGLVLSGGDGVDGHIALAAINQVEMGGTLLMEAANVQLSSPSDGVLCGMYVGAIQRTDCFAGYNVRQSGGATLLTPFVNGAEVGTSYTLLNGHSYTLRIRLHSPEVQRVLQTYYARVEGGVQSFGGGRIDAPMSLVFDLIDLGNASNTRATVLYDGAVSSAPTTCIFAAVDSMQLTGSIGAVLVEQTGSAWVTSTLGDSSQTRLVGTAAEGADCSIDGAGKVTFFPGCVPLAGETVSVFYRTRNRAVARLQDAASVAAEATGGVPGTARWLGKVVRPQARSSQDCEAAAQAVLALATDRSAAISGTYACVNPADDIWPGDALAMTANGQTTNVVARRVNVIDGHAMPEVLTYKVAFANDWAESLGIALSEAVATDAFLPQTAATAPAQSLANLQQMTVVSATSTALQLDAGCDPPAGGGFEVRRHDWNFGPGPGADLVLRSPVRSFSIPRGAVQERFYVRMYDTSAEPLYSRLSAAVFTNLPVG